MDRPIRQILHPTDFSDAARNAMRVAGDLARRANAEVVLVHTYDQPYAYSYYAGAIPALADANLEEQWRADFGKKMDELAQSPELKGLTVRKKLIVNLPVWKFYEDMDLRQGDLIVMGTTGNTGFLHGGLLGTNAERTIRHSPIPVLTVPVEYQWTGEAHEIVMLTDYNEDPRRVFLALWPFVRLFNAHVTVATVSTPSEFYTDEYVHEEFSKLKADFPMARLDCRTVNALSMEKGVEVLAREQNADLLAMYTHGRNAFFQFFQKGSNTEQVAANVHNSALLALKPR